MTTSTRSNDVNGNQDLQARPSVKASEANGQTTGSFVSEPVVREFIDARGSIDSRTFSEEQRITSIGKDKHHERDSVIDLNSSQKHWRSRPGKRGVVSPSVRTTRSRLANGAKFIRLSGGTPNKFGGYERKLAGASLPPQLAALIVIIVLLAIVAIALWFL